MASPLDNSPQHLPTNLNVDTASLFKKEERLPSSWHHSVRFYSAKTLNKVAVESFLVIGIALLVAGAYYSVIGTSLAAYPLLGGGFLCVFGSTLRGFYLSGEIE
jgi:hypothetical protein